MNEMGGDRSNTITFPEGVIEGQGARRKHWVM